MIKQQQYLSLDPTDSWKKFIFNGFFFCFVLIILYSLYLEYDSPLLLSASGLAG
jgi:hypothetical protein